VELHPNFEGGGTVDIIVCFLSACIGQSSNLRCWWKWNHVFREQTGGVGGVVDDRFLDF